MYASLCHVVCIALLLPFLPGFCLSVFLVCLFVFIVFSTCYHWWISFLDWLLSSFFFLFFMLLFYIFNNFFILITFILFYFTLLYFLPPLLPLSLPSLVVADRV